jgi:hypothetical protein
VIADPARTAKPAALPRFTVTALDGLQKTEAKRIKAKTALIFLRDVEKLNEDEFRINKFIYFLVLDVLISNI